MIKVKKLIENDLFSLFKEHEIVSESYISLEHYIKNAFFVLEGKKISAIPISFGYNVERELSGKVLSLEKIYPGYVINKSFKGKILFVKELSQYEIRYLVEIEPSAVLTTSDIQKPLFIQKFPVFKVPFPFIGGEKIKIFFKVKEEEELYTVNTIDFGFGNYFLYIHFPYDPRFDEPEDINFYSSYLVMKDIVDRLINVGYPRGYKVRLIFSEGKFSNYAGLEKYISKQSSENILSIINIDGVGLGNEKLITISNHIEIIDPFHIEKVEKLMKDMGVSIKKEKLLEYIDLSFTDIPFIWFFSQPNIHMYELDKEFLSEKYPKEFASYIFYLVNNLYKEIL